MNEFDVIKKEIISRLGLSMREILNEVRFGRIDIKSFSDDEIRLAIDFHLPPPVMQLCFNEIARRRNENLEGKE